MSDWFYANNYLPAEQTEHNAKLVTQFLLKHFWSKNAIAAVLGNMRGESGINPGIWENLQPFAGGYGLVQWTPYTKYSEWAIANGYSNWNGNGDAQMERIIYESKNGLQWIANRPMSFENFTKSDESIEYLTEVWLYNYERPADPAGTLQTRINYALGLYDSIVKDAVNVLLLILMANKRRRVMEDEQ